MNSCTRVEFPVFMVTRKRLTKLMSSMESQRVREKAKEPTAKKPKKSDAAKKVGALLARRCQEKSIDKVVFDRNGYLYHGRVKALADAARAAGLKF